MLAYIMHSSKGVFCCRYDFRECVIDIMAEMNQANFQTFFCSFFFILSFYHQILSLIKKKSYVQL